MAAQVHQRTEGLAGVWAMQVQSSMQERLQAGMVASTQASCSAAARRTGLVPFSLSHMVCADPGAALRVAVRQGLPGQPPHSRPEPVPASLDLKGFHTRYSVLSMVPGSVPGFCTLTRFSPYTLSPARPVNL